MPNRLASEKSPYLLQHAVQSRRLVSVGRRGVRGRAPRGQADLPVHRLRHLPLVPRDGARVVRGPGDCQVAQLAISSRSRSIARSGPTWTASTCCSCRRRPGSGGWPMSVWLTPELQPFYGGTYFPPDGRYGRPGFAAVLEEISRAWQENRDGVVRSAARLTARIRGFASAGPQPQAERARPRAPSTAAVREFEAAFDSRRGGFGGAPKFPRPAELLFLLREFARTGRACRPRHGAAARFGPWPTAGCATTSAAGSTATRWMPTGACRTSRRCSTTRRSSSLAYLEAHQVTGRPGLRRRRRRHAALRRARDD